MKLNYKLSQIALKDIEGIWNYTAEQWSKQQANKYYRQIFSVIDEVCQNPEKGRSIDHIKEGFRRVNIKSHMIIYKNDERILFVDRILHQRMDIERQLKE